MNKKSPATCKHIVLKYLVTSNVYTKKFLLYLFFLVFVVWTIKQLL